MTSSTPIALRCPKCAGEMTTYERSGIHIDQCRECRGVFLDRGELERLMDLEAEALAAGRRDLRAPTGGPGPSAGAPAGVPAGWTDPRWDPRYASDPRYATDPRGRGQAWDDDDDDDRSRDRRDAGWDRGGDRGRSRKRSFLGELFEGFGD